MYHPRPSTSYPSHTEPSPGQTNPQERNFVLSQTRTIFLPVHPNIKAYLMTIIFVVSVWMEFRWHVRLVYSSSRILCRPLRANQMPITGNCLMTKTQVTVVYQTHTHTGDSRVHMCVYVGYLFQKQLMHMQILT